MFEQLSKIRELISGKKTYLLAVAAIITALVACGLMAAPPEA